MEHDIGEKLKDLRKSRGLSQTGLAMKLNVSNKLISKWETGGAVPNIEYLKRYSEIFSISLDCLLDNEVHVNHAIDYDKIETKRMNRKAAYAGVAVSCVIFIAWLMSTLTAVFVIPNSEFPVWGKLLAFILPGTVIVSLLVQAAIRVREIRDGEEEESGKY